MHPPNGRLQPNVEVLPPSNPYSGKGKLPPEFDSLKKRVHEIDLLRAEFNELREQKAQPGPPGEPGRPGRDGKDFTQPAKSENRSPLVLLLFPFVFLAALANAFCSRASSKMPWRPKHADSQATRIPTFVCNPSVYRHLFCFFRKEKNVEQFTTPTGIACLVMAALLFAALTAWGVSYVFGLRRFESNAAAKCSAAGLPSWLVQPLLDFSIGDKVADS